MRGATNKRLSDLKPIDYRVLDSLMDDCESVQTLLTFINHPEVGSKALNGGRDFKAQQIVNSAKRLVEAQLIRAMEADQTKGEWKKTQKRFTSQQVWFHLTAKGKSIWKKWAAKDQ